MELSHSLTLNEDALNKIPPQNRPVFVFEWLRFLDKVLVAAQKNDIKGCQKKLVDQLTTHINSSPGPPTRKLIAQCLATLFSVGDTFLLFDTVNKCNDILKNKDDSPSFLPTRLAAICCIGCMYEKLGRMMGRSYEETISILLRSLKSAESQTRIEIMVTLRKVCAGMGTAISNVHKDIYKGIRQCLTDRNIGVRIAASKCLLEMVNHSTFLYTTELESLAALCFRAFDGSSYEVRCAVAKLLGSLISFTQNTQPPNPMVTASSKITARTLSLDESLNVLMSGFLRGGLSFLKGTGEIIKGNSGINREVRVGVTHAYVVFVDAMGSIWLERNLSTFLLHVLDLVANPKCASSHVDAVYSRKCINFILRSTIGKMLGEKAQTSACKELIHIIAKQMNSIDFNPENAKDSNQETIFSQHLLVCALQELSALVVALGTTSQNLITEPSLNFVDVICSVLIHPCLAARLSAAWLLRCICVAVPSQITLLIDRFIDAIETMKSSPEAISGYSSALSAVLESVRLSPLGIPHTKGKILFNTAEELLRSASQNSRLSLSRTTAGWLLIGAIMTLGAPVVKSLLPRMLLLWRNSFPRSTKELDSEKARGDAFTWQVTLEARAGALSVMYSFLLNCPELVTEDITKRLLTPIESALAMLVNLSTVLKTYGQSLKAPAAIVRLRLYETLSLLPPNTLESSYTHLLRMLISEFTLSDNPANTTTSLLRSICRADESVILGTCLQETDHRKIEDQLQQNSAAGSGALEHDPCCLYRPILKTEYCPGPLPLGVAVIDMSVSLFGLIFPRVANKHRIQMLAHFTDCIKHAKSVRQETIQINIFSALLCGLKGLTETKSSIGQDEVKKAATALILSGLVSANPNLRCAAAEALGRIAQVVSDSKFTAELAQTSFDRLKLARDVVTRTGHSLALGCLHHYVGGMGSSQHLNTSVSILLALAQDGSSPIVQVWSMYALALIADSGGPMFKGYIEPTLSLLIKLLLMVPQTNVDVHQCIGRVLSALITTIGPELQGNTSSITTTRSSFLCACAIMQSHSDPLVKAEATGCLQQLHLFAPRHVNLSTLVPTLCQILSSNYLMLRKAAVSCLRQLTQREAKEVCDHAISIANTEGMVKFTDSGLPGILFGMLDTETDAEMIKNIHDTITSMLQRLASENLSTWLSLCKNVLTIATEVGNEDLAKPDLVVDDDAEDEEDNDGIEYHAEENKETHPAVQPRWPTRVYAAECIRRIISTCETSDPAHFDLSLAKEMQITKSSGDYLVLHVSDLIRMAFIAATSDSDQLRLEGLKTLQEIIDKFSRVPEPEFPGHLILEQFQAQVGAALRPAFSPDTPSHVTAAACEVCSAWIGSGVARDLNDLRRVHQLLVSSLSKLETKTNSTQLYNESMATLEKLSILKAWAEVYIVAMIGNGSAPASFIMKKLTSSAVSYTITTKTNSDDNDFGCRSESLLTLVQPELKNLSKHWLDAITDHALLLLPTEFSSQLPRDGGSFYTNDTINSSKPHYSTSWLPILHAAALWLNADVFSVIQKSDDEIINNETDANLNPITTTDDSTTSYEDNGNTVVQRDIKSDRFLLIFGTCIEALCSIRTTEKVECVIITCLQSLYTIMDSKWSRNKFIKTDGLTVELCNVLHRLILTRDNIEIKLLCMEVLKQTIVSATEFLDAIKLEKSSEDINDNNDEDQTTSMKSDCDNLGEGGEEGQILPGKSHVYSVLEVCLCLFVRQMPQINPSPRFMSDHIQAKLRASMTNNGMFKLNDDNNMLITSGLKCLENLPRLCSPRGAVSILPTILYLTTSIIKELATKSVNDQTILADSDTIQSAINCLRCLACDPYSSNDSSSKEWMELLQSSLAKIIDLTNTRSEETKLDELTMMQVITVFILHVPANYISIPNIQYPCINHFRQCLMNENNIIKLKALQTMRLVFSRANLKVSTPYIHALTPRIIEYLYSSEAKSPKNDNELAIDLESIMTLDTLTFLAESKNRIQLLVLLIPILISFLLETSSIKTSNKQTVQLHEQSLQWLMKIGPKYPQEFKTLMGQSPELRQKLKTSIRNNQQTSMQKTKMEMQNATRNNLAQQQQKPIIKLKTDFSNFN